MALISCNECGNQVSEKATSCPNCGAPISDNNTVSLKPGSKVKVTRSGLKWEAAGFILIAISIFKITAEVIRDKGYIGVVMFLVGIVLFLIGRFK